MAVGEVKKGRKELSATLWQIFFLRCLSSSWLSITISGAWQLYQNVEIQEPKQEGNFKIISISRYFQFQENFKFP